MAPAEPGGVRARIAVISLHTSPLDQPGAGDSGGMNVYVRSVADRLADLGVEIDVFTRCAGRGVPEVEDLGPLTRVIQVPAGPCTPVPKADLPALVPAFIRSVLQRDARRYDLVHAHYWLSGAVGAAAKERWRVPLVASFHTLGKVKNMALIDGEQPEPQERLAGELRTIRAADRILAPTPVEAAHLTDLYGAHPDRIRVVPPGVDTARFHPRQKQEAKEAMGLGGSRVAMFLGRLQSMKGPDVAIRTVAAAVARAPQLTRDLILAVVGGPSGSPARGQLAHLAGLAAELGVGHRVRFFRPRPHRELPGVYGAADVLLMPSRSESFGLAALEAQACGVPVVASSVGGLRYVVADGLSGLLVGGHDPADHADRLLAVLGDQELAGRLARGAVAQAARFPWEDTTEGVHSAYSELVPRLAPVAVP